MRATILATIITIATFNRLCAQDYLHAAGYRGGVTEGLQYKVCTNEINAYELMLSFRKGGLQLTGLALFHNPSSIGNSEKFFWYYGFGAHVGYYKIRRCPDCYPVDSAALTPIPPKTFYTTNVALGVDVIGGLEYRFLSMPITVGVDWKPFLGFFGPARISRNMGDWGLSIKYIFE